MAHPASQPVQIFPLSGIPEVEAGADLGELVLEACARDAVELQDGDVIVFTQKVVSKAEGRIVHLAEIQPSAIAESFAREAGRDPRAVEVVLRASRRVVKMDRGILITETEGGLVCAHAGVDASNLPEPDTVSLLPRDPDASARKLREELEARTSRRLAVIVSDTFGRPWREGVTNVAIGVAGMAPLVDYRGQTDSGGRSLSATVVALADELAGAAELVMRKLDRIPVAVIRGVIFTAGKGSAAELVRPAEKDLFR